MIRSDGSPPHPMAKKSEKLSFSVERLISSVKKDDKIDADECSTAVADDRIIKPNEYPLVPVPLLARNSAPAPGSLLAFPLVSPNLGLSPTGSTSIVSDSSPTGPISFTHFSWLPGDGDNSGTYVEKLSPEVFAYVLCFEKLF